MKTEKEIHVYLAGPDVFYPDPDERGVKKKAYLKSLGLIGHYPRDNEFDLQEGETPAQLARRISSANEQMIMQCFGEDRVAVGLFNMEPFRSPYMDTGTAFEAGFMSALSYQYPDTLLVGYSHDQRTVEQRVSQDLYGGNVKEIDGNLIDPDGKFIEAFSLAENLMITEAIERTGGQIFPSFEKAASFISEKLTA